MSESAERVEEVLDRLRETGGRATTSRRILLQCLFAEGPHRTAEELAEEVQRVAPDVHLSTIYRNLDELERLGVVVHAHLGHGPATYHLASRRMDIWCARSVAGRWKRQKDSSAN